MLAVVVALCHLPLSGRDEFVTVRLEPLGEGGARRAEPIRATRLEELPGARRRVVENFLLVESPAEVLAAGRGGGLPGVSGLGTTQVIYDDPEFGEPVPGEGAGLLVAWTEDGIQESIELLVDGFNPIAVQPRADRGTQLFLVTGFPRCDPAVTPDCPQASFAECTNDVERENLFRVSISGSDGTSESVCQEIFRSWPLANFATFCCRPADAEATECEDAIFTTAAVAGRDCARNANAKEGGCGIVVTGGNGGPSASQIAIFLDDGNPGPALVLEDAVEIKCFEALVPVETEREFEVTVFGVLNREKASGTTWNDPVNLTSFSGLDGSFVGIDPNIVLGRVPTPEMTCSVRSSCTTQPQFRRGDANADGSTDLSDGLFVLVFLFSASEGPPCKDSMDINDSGNINISDAIDLFNFLFVGSDAPPPPFGFCGPDPTADELGCEADFQSSGLCN